MSLAFQSGTGLIIAFVILLEFFDQDRLKISAQNHSKYYELIPYQTVFERIFSDCTFFISQNLLTLLDQEINEVGSWQDQAHPLVLQKNPSPKKSEIIQSTCTVGFSQNLKDFDLSTTFGVILLQNKQELTQNEDWEFQLSLVNSSTMYFVTFLETDNTTMSASVSSLVIFAVCVLCPQKLIPLELENILTLPQPHLRRNAISSNWLKFSKNLQGNSILYPDRDILQWFSNCDHLGIRFFGEERICTIMTIVKRILNGTVVFSSNSEKLKSNPKIVGIVRNTLEEYLQISNYEFQPNGYLVEPFTFVMILDKSLNHQNLNMSPFDDATDWMRKLILVLLAATFAMKMSIPKVPALSTVKSNVKKHKKKLMKKTIIIQSDLGGQWSLIRGQLFQVTCQQSMKNHNQRILMDNLTRRVVQSSFQNELATGVEPTQRSQSQYNQNQQDSDLVHDSVTENLEKYNHKFKFVQNRIQRKRNGIKDRLVQPLIQWLINFIEAYVQVVMPIYDQCDENIARRLQLRSTDNVFYTLLITWLLLASIVINGAYKGGLFSILTKELPPETPMTLSDLIRHSNFDILTTDLRSISFGTKNKPPILRELIQEELQSGRLSGIESGMYAELHERAEVLATSHGVIIGAYQKKLDIGNTFIPSISKLQRSKIGKPYHIPRNFAMIGFQSEIEHFVSLMKLFPNVFVIKNSYVDPFLSLKLVTATSKNIFGQKLFPLFYMAIHESGIYKIWSEYRENLFLKSNLDFVACMYIAENPQQAYQNGCRNFDQIKERIAIRKSLFTRKKFRKINIEIILRLSSILWAGFAAAVVAFSIELTIKYWKIFKIRKNQKKIDNFKHKFIK